MNLLKSALAVMFGLSCAGAPVYAQTENNNNDDIEHITVDASQVELRDSFAGGQVSRGGRAGILGNLDMMDSPFASTNFTADIIREQQARSIADVLQNDPVVRVAKGFGNFQELYVMRGFPVYSDDMTYNGLYGVLPRQYVAAELSERVEVFRGASAFLNGAAPGGSGLGGSVNIVPKRAGDDPLNRVTLGYESQGHWYGAADVSRRFGDDSQSTGVRANFVQRGGETSIDNQDRELSVAAIGIDHGSDNFRLSLDLGYQDHQVDSPRPAVTPGSAIPEAPDSDTNFAQEWTYTNERQFFGAVRGEYDFTDNITAWAAYGFRSGEEDNVFANPRQAEANGDFSAYRFDNVRNDEIRSGEVGLNIEFKTASVGHTIITSASTFSLESENAYAFSDFSGFAGNIYNPVTATMPDADFFIGGDLSNPLITEKTDLSSFALADMISFNDGKILLTLGGRVQNIETRTFDYNTGDELSGYDESQFTPVVGIVYKSSEQVSYYANYIEGLLPGEVAPASSGGEPIENAGEAFDPYSAEQIEVGVKYDAGQYGGSLSVFNTSKQSSIIKDNVFSTDGEQQNQGLELSVFGMPTSNLRVLGGFTWLDAEMTKTQDGTLDGKTAIGVPDLQANINIEWDVDALPGLTVDARAAYTSKQYASADNSLEVDASNRFDLGVRYSFFAGMTDITLRARVDNVFDNNYWASVGGFPGSNYLVLSEPRTFRLSASFNF
ncbi:TonB-dependent receptor [Alteromonas macleodii]|uniref:TonB-dependent receptor n=1 Tax=Alteromonas macleodii TaxID=28108 RepID=UPI001279918E|nr:TonB-dependent siderophore receptor [Alteromonas macleodii]CAI2391250.1 iron complex outermembrane recepter protein [Alteromonas macleodii]CAI3965679.1 iron complex outermembrane recepter protein [Alteromonas macleodii]CAI3966060.1 iron complex outermembrane recepter protein [Alteromonas macleodii]CAI3966063.1 iron complex outermembrane recepter protein [Alteromonas macleodii]VTO40847.1 iron complex outermembrane recepter protein [Alteromonas macleodii]